MKKELSPTELIVLELSVGRTYQQIADIRGVSIHAIKQTMERIYLKYNVPTKIRALALARRRGDIK